MISIKITLYLLILVIGIPFGLFLSKACREETRNWRNRLIAITIISLSLAVTIYLTLLTLREPITVALLFIAISCGAIIMKDSYSH